MSLGPSGNPTVQGRLAKLEGIARSDFDHDAKHVMGTLPGRRFVWRLLNQFNVFGYTGMGEALPYLSGTRDAGVWLMEAAQNADPALYAEMLADRQREIAEEKLHHDDARERAAREEANG